MTDMVINLPQDFSRYPAGRYQSDGPFSGEKFRDEYLAPSLDKVPSGGYLHITLDGARGYGSSFLEEAFGGLMRQRKDLTPEIFWGKIKIITDDPSLLQEIREYIADARK